MHERRLVGIDLGVTSAHTAQVVRGDGTRVCRRSCWPQLDSLLELEQAALEGAPEETRLEVVIEPTGPVWLPIAVFFIRRGHLVYRVSSAKAHDLRRYLSRHAKSNNIDALTLAKLPLFESEGLVPLELGSHEQAALDRRVRVCDRLTRASAVHKTRLKDLVRHLLPLSPLDGDILSNGDVAVLLETGADPHHLLRLGKARLTRTIRRASRGHLGAERAEQWLYAAGEAIRLFNDHPAVAFQELAEEVKTEARLLRHSEAELALHAKDRAQAYTAADPKGLARSLPGVGQVGAANLVAAIGRPGRFRNGRQVRSFCGLTPKSSETGETDQKGQSITKAGPSRVRTALVLSANIARRLDPQLARIYFLQMTERGATHTKALCVVAANLAERVWAVMERGESYEVRDTDGRPVSPDEARAIIAEKWTVPEEVRRRRRGRKHAQGKAPQQVGARHARPRAESAATRRPSPEPIVTEQPTHIKDVVALVAARAGVRT